MDLKNLGGWKMEQPREERLYLMYVELPNLINRIMKLYIMNCPNSTLSIRLASRTAKEIKRISNTEINSALETIKTLDEK